MLPIGTKKAKAGAGAAIFKVFSLGVATNRDAWAYNFGSRELVSNIQKTIEFYNQQLLKWQKLGDKSNLDDFVENDDLMISWTGGLKDLLRRGIALELDEAKVRRSMYRPFAEECLYFDPFLNQRRYQMPRIFPNAETENENLIICVPGIGNRRPFACYMTNLISSLDFFEKTQCFPFYSYDKAGTNRRENITGWAVEQFSSALGSSEGRIFCAVKMWTKARLL